MIYTIYIYILYTIIYICVCVCVDDWCDQPDLRGHPSRHLRTKCNVLRWSSDWPPPWPPCPSATPPKDQSDYSPRPHRRSRRAG